MQPLVARRRIGCNALLVHLFQGGALRRCLSGAAEQIPLASYECSKWAIPEMELSLMESSLKNGCRHVITRSCAHLDATMTGLKNLAANNADFQVSLILALGKDSDQQRLERWKHELYSLATSLDSTRPSIIRHILFQSPLLQLDHLRATLRDVQSLLADASVNLSGASLGLSLDTSQLIALAQDPASLQATSSAMNTLYAEHRLACLALACNGMTHAAARSLSHALRPPSPFHLVLTDQLRTHPVKPGLVWSQYDFFPSRASLAATTAAIPDLDAQTPSVLQPAVHDLKLALDHCFQVEQQLLDRWSKETPPSPFPLESVCLAHLLLAPASPLASVDAPEEFDMVMHLHVQPRHAAQLHELHARGGVWANWTRLYRPMTAYLLAAQRRVLQAQCLAGAGRAMREVLRGEAGDEDGDGDGDGGAGIPYWVAALGARALRADEVGFQLCKVDPAVLREHVCKVQALGGDAASHLSRIHAGIREQLPSST